MCAAAGGPAAAHCGTVLYQGAFGVVTCLVCGDNVLWRADVTVVSSGESISLSLHSPCSFIS